MTKSGFYSNSNSQMTKSKKGQGKVRNTSLRPPTRASMEFGPGQTVRLAVITEDYVKSKAKSEASA